MGSRLLSMVHSWVIIIGWQFVVAATHRMDVSDRRSGLWSCCLQISTMFSTRCAG